jgi:hypothetical protein
MPWPQRQADLYVDRTRRERQGAFCAQMDPEKIQIPQALGRRPAGMPLAKGTQYQAVAIVIDEVETEFMIDEVICRPPALSPKQRFCHRSPGW